MSALRFITGTETTFGPPLVVPFLETTHMWVTTELDKTLLSYFNDFHLKPSKAAWPFWSEIAESKRTTDRNERRHTHTHLAWMHYMRPLHWEFCPSISIFLFLDVYAQTYCIQTTRKANNLWRGEKEWGEGELGVRKKGKMCARMIRTWIHNSGFESRLEPETTTTTIATADTTTTTMCHSNWSPEAVREMKTFLSKFSFIAL